jgi:hypothetical protein
MLDHPNWSPALVRHEQRGADRMDAHGRLRAGVICERKHYLRAGRIAFEAARLTILPTRATPRTYIRKGVRYAVFAEDGVIWVRQQVEEAPTPPAGAPAAPDAV